MPWSREDSFFLKAHVPCIAYFDTPKHMNLCPRGHDIYTLSKLFIGHHYNILSLSYLCMGQEKKIIKEIIKFTLLLLLSPSTRTPAPGSMKF